MLRLHYLSHMRYFYFGVVFLPILLLIAVPNFAVAQGLVPMQCESPQSCGTCEFVQLINNVINFLITFAVIAATLLIMYAGFRLVTSGGDVSAKTAAKSMMSNVLIGIVLVLTGFLIINTVLGVLVPGDSPVLGWRQVECLYPTVPVTVPYQAFGADGFIGFTDQQAGTGSVGACQVAASGPCSVGALQASGFGALASDAARLVGMESGCNTSALSRTDQTTDGRTTSVGVWQIHMPAHAVNCGAQQLDCPSAFRDSGRRNEFNVRMYDVLPGAEQLYNDCVAALQNPACNHQIAARLANNSGDMGDWACSAVRCGVQTSRNNRCPLPGV